ncbi:hypothetical protein THRCLA_10040 [Thraustotheca clavata]|uniref:Aminotransferase class I/classII large domain-containing protein n=1 Tax=Thraustotheca clavata TaxID=74557 RepID=A0A1V9YTC6_9STRA|nr:hypothetical protein THRCLA_10040 [Thraustotheca clavata]
MAVPKLSVRGQRALKPALSYWGLTTEALKTEATEANLDGQVIVSVSENRIFNSTKFLNKLHNSLAKVEKPALGYDDFTGRRGFKEAYAAFANDTLLPASSKGINPAHVCVSSGVGSLLAHLSSIFQDPGDGILLATPTYGALYNDFTVSAGAKVIDVPMTKDYELSVELFDAAYNQARSNNITPKSVVLLNPDNPLGVIRGRDLLIELSRWCEEKGLHFIVDEIYANSIHTPENSAYPFESAVAVLGNNESEFTTLPEHVHVLWGFSKDWATSGLRAGVIYSSNQDVYNALSNVLYFSGVSNYLLDGLATMLQDLPWCKQYLAENNALLHDAYASVAQVLESHNVPFVPASSGMFVWIDLRRCLSSPTWEAEQELMEIMFTHGKFVMTPGEAQHAPAPGYFRICFGYNTPKVVAHGLNRTLEYLNHK